MTLPNCSAKQLSHSAFPLETYESCGCCTFMPIVGMASQKNVRHFRSCITVYHCLIYISLMTNNTRKFSHDFWYLYPYFWCKIPENIMSKGDLFLLLRGRPFSQICLPRGPSELQELDISCLEFKTEHEKSHINLHVNLWHQKSESTSNYEWNQY